VLSNMQLNKLFRTPKNQVSTPRPECGVGFDSSARAMNRDTKENVSLVSFERKQMLNTLKRKIALVAVSAVGMSGLALMSAPAANAAVATITSVETVPKRAATLATGLTSATFSDTALAISITANSDTTQVNNVVAGETVTLRGRVLVAPTAAAVDSTTQIAAGATLAAVAYLPSTGAATVTLTGNAAGVTSDSVTVNGTDNIATKAFRTAGTYSILIWRDTTAQFDGGSPAVGGNGTIDGGEAYITASITIGGSPTQLAVSSNALTTAGTTKANLAITLKDVNNVPTLLRGVVGTESITVSSAIATASTETFTIFKGKSTSLGLGNHGQTSRVDSQVTNGATLVTSLFSGDSVTASTGAYDINMNHTGATSSTLTFNLGGSLIPTTPAAVSLTTTAAGTITGYSLTNASGVTTTENKLTAPVAIDTPTTGSVAYFVSTAVSTVGLKLTGTAGGIVNVVISGSTVTGVTNGTYPVTIGTDGTATYNLTSTAAPTAATGYTVGLTWKTGVAATTAASFTVTYATPTVTAQAIGSNGISTNLLSSTVTSAIQKIGATTSLVVTVKDQFGTAMQYYAVTPSLTTGNRNKATVFTPVLTGADGVATISLADVSTSTTVLTDQLAISVTAPGAATNLLSSGNTLTITYSTSGAYDSLTLTGGTTATVTVTKEIESTTAADLSAVNLTTSLKNVAGTAIPGVSLVVTGSDGLVFRKEATKTTRPVTGDVTTLTIASGDSFTVIATKPGTATVTVVGGGLTQTATFTVSAAKVATARNITAVAAAGRVTATVKDGFGNPVAGVQVSFAADAKGVFGNGTSSTSAATDASGTATAVVQSADATGADTVVIASHTGNQSASLVDSPVEGFTAAVASATVTAKPTAGAASTDTAISAVKTDVATANAAVKALATQVTVLQASVATLIDSLTTQIASLMKSVGALTKAVAKLQAKK
jgi:adhesin/invasin